MDPITTTALINRPTSRNDVWIVIAIVIVVLILGYIAIRNFSPEKLSNAASNLTGNILGQTSGLVGNTLGQTQNFISGTLGSVTDTATQLALLPLALPKEVLTNLIPKVKNLKFW